MDLPSPIHQLLRPDGGNKSAVYGVPPSSPNRSSLTCTRAARALCGIPHRSPQWLSSHVTLAGGLPEVRGRGQRGRRERERLCLRGLPAGRHVSEPCTVTERVSSHVGRMTEHDRQHKSAAW